MDPEAAMNETLPVETIRTPVEAVVVTFNSMKDLPGMLECSELLTAFTRILSVDNDSVDDTVSTARAAGVDVLQMGSNAGFGPAANHGIRATDSDLVCLLNPDIRLTEPTTLQALARHFADPRVGMVAPSLILPDGSMQDSARSIPTPFDLASRRLLKLNLGWQKPDAPAVVPWVVGAFIVLRRSAFEAVGGFDPRYKMYFEDVDLAVRMRRAGWKVILDPTVKASHFHRAESRKSWLGWTMRQHILSAAKFYRRNPRYLLSRR